jgi:thioredoxin 1
MIFDTTVGQIKSVDEFNSYLKNNPRAVICAGRWGPMCIPVYKAMEQMEEKEKYKDVRLLVVDFDTTSANSIRMDEKCRSFRGLPFTAYYLNGEMVHATSSIQTKQQLEENIEKYLK